MEKIRKTILRTHGTIIILIGVVMTIKSTIGTTQGTGIFDFLQQNPLAHAGLLQAYLLMAVIGLTLWKGAASGNPRRWHIVGALAHLPPLLAVVMYWGLFHNMGLGWMLNISLVLHSTFLLVESTAYVYKAPGEGQAQRPSA